MDRFVRCDLSEFRSFVVKYAHHNPNQHDAIQSVLETVIQSELRSSTHESQQAPDATPSIPQSHPATHDVNNGESYCSIDSPSKDQNKPTGRWRGAKGKDQIKPTGRRRITKGKPRSIIVPYPVSQLSPAGLGERVQSREMSSREASSTSSPPPVASEETLPTYTTEHAPLDDPSASNGDLQRKRRKRGSGAGAAPSSHAEVETTSSSKPNESFTSVQPQTSDEAALPPGLVRKLGLIGGIEVMRDLRKALFRLRSHGSQDLLIPSCVTSAPYNGAALNTPSSLKTAQMLTMLRNELELSKIGEQLHKFRKRLAQSRFLDFYLLAQKHPESFLQATAQTTEGPSRNEMSKQSFGMKSRVLHRIVDLMFPDTAHTDEDTVAAEGSFGQIQRRRQRRAVVKKVSDRRRNAKPWSAMVQRFGEGILLLLPKSLSEENVRTKSIAQLQGLLDLMESIMSPSKVLLRSANVLSRSLARHQAPAEILKIETDLTLMDIDAECSRQDLDTLLEPCGVVNPLQGGTQCTVQVEQRSESHAPSPSLSPLRRIHVAASLPIDSKYLTRLETLKGILSVSKPPAKRGFSTMNSNLSSPARRLAPTFFQSTVNSNPISTAKVPVPTSSQSTVNSNLSSPARLATPSFFRDALGDLRSPSLASPVS